MSSSPLAPVLPSAAAPAGAPFRAAWALLALAAVALLWVMGGVWAATPEMNDRVLIPLAAAWCVYRLRSRWATMPARPSPLGLVPLALGAVAFPTGWFLLVQVGPRVILLWWLLAALALAVLGLAALQLGWGRARYLVFPLAFTFFALPAPDFLMARLQPVLQEGTTTAAAGTLSALGHTVERKGFVLHLPSGDLGVVEACSGVRSVTALTAIAVFVAYIRGLGMVRGAILLAASFGIIVISNAVRVVVSGLLQEYVGRWAIEGWYHEALGASVVLVGLAAIVGTSSLLARHRSRDESPAPVPFPSTPFAARGGAIALILLAAAVVGCSWAEQFRQAHREDVQLAQLPYSVGGWTARDVPIHPTVLEMLKCDQIIQRAFTDPLGREVVVYVMFWATPASTAHIHHPDVCWPNRGWELTQTAIREVPLGDGSLRLPVSSRIYSQDDNRQIVYYWTQRGREVLPDGAEPQQTFLAEYAWVGAMLSGQAPMAREARLSVLLGADVNGAPAQLEPKLQQFTAALATEVFRLCPWAMPDGENDRKKDDPAGTAGL